MWIMSTGLYMTNITRKRVNFINAINKDNRDGKSVSMAEFSKRANNLRKLSKNPTTAQLGWERNPSWVKPNRYKSGGKIYSAEECSYDTPRPFVIFNRKNY